VPRALGYKCCAVNRPRGVSGKDNLDGMSDPEGDAEGDGMRRDVRKREPAEKAGNGAGDVMFSSRAVRYTGAARCAPANAVDPSICSPAHFGWCRLAAEGL